MQDFSRLRVATPAVLALIAGIKGINWYGEKKKKEGKWQSEVDSDRASFKEFMEEIRGVVNQIHTRIDSCLVSWTQLLPAKVLKH